MDGKLVIAWRQWILEHVYKLSSVCTVCGSVAVVDLFLGGFSAVACCTTDAI